MAFKNILLHLNDLDNTTQLLQVAVSLASRAEAHLAGLYVLPSPIVPTMPETVIRAELLASHREASQEKADAAEQRFEEVTRNQPFTTEWRVADAAIEASSAIVADQARTADITIISQREPGSSDHASVTVERTVMDSGRPAIVVPSSGDFTKLGENILIAWNGSKESARAAFDALPLLKSASIVHILTIQSNSNESSPMQVPGADLAIALARHGVNCETARFVKGDVRVGDLILNYVSDHAIDLIVMGCYGHARIREVIFGGATRQLLEQATAPLLMSH